MGGCCSGGGTADDDDENDPYAQLLDEIARKGYRGQLVEGAIVDAAGALLYRVGTPAYLLNRGGEGTKPPRQASTTPYMDCVNLLSTISLVSDANDTSGDAEPKKSSSSGKAAAQFPSVDTAVHVKGATHLTAVHFMRDKYIVVVRVSYDSPQALQAVDCDACLGNAKRGLLKLRAALPAKWRGGSREGSIASLNSPTSMPTTSHSQQDAVSFSMLKLDEDGGGRKGGRSSSTTWTVGDGGSATASSTQQTSPRTNRSSTRSTGRDTSSSSRTPLTSSTPSAQLLGVPPLHPMRSVDFGNGGNAGAGADTPGPHSATTAPTSTTGQDSCVGVRSTCSGFDQL